MGSVLKRHARVWVAQVSDDGKSVETIQIRGLTLTVVCEETAQWIQASLG